MKIVAERMKGQLAPVTILDAKGKEIIKQGRRISKRHINLIKRAKITSLDTDATQIIGKVMGHSLVNKETGEELVPLNHIIDESTVKTIIEHGIDELSLLSINDLDRGPYISDTLRADITTSENEALVEIYRVMRPGEPPTIEASKSLFNNCLLYTSPSPRDATLSRMPSSA